MHHIETKDVNSAQTHGGQQCRITYDAVVIRQLLTNIKILNHSNLTITFNNADRFYNRMRPKICSIVLRQFDCPHSIASFCSHTLIHMTHNILTFDGQSEVYSIIHISYAWKALAKLVLEVEYHDTAIWNLSQMHLQNPHVFKFSDITNTSHILQQMIPTVRAVHCTVSGLLLLSENCTNIW